MSLLDRLRPKWQNADPDVRAEAVKGLDKSETELLEAVAKHDPDARVRRIAVKRIESPRTLLSIYEEEEDEKLAAFAKKRARHALVHIACDERDESESLRALSLLDVSNDIVRVVKRASFEPVRKAAFEALEEKGDLATLVCKTKDTSLQSKALEKLSEPEELKRIVIDASGDVAIAATALAKIADVAALEFLYRHPSLARSLRRQAQSQLEPLVPEDHPVHADKRRERQLAIVERAEGLAHATHERELGAIEALSREWGDEESKFSVDSALSRRFRQAESRIAAARRKLEAAASDDAPGSREVEQTIETTPPERTEAGHAPEDGTTASETDGLASAELQQLGARLSALDALASESVDSELSAIKARLEEWAQRGDVSRRIRNLVETSLAETSTRLARWREDESKRERVSSLLQEIEALLAPLTPAPNKVEENASGPDEVPPAEMEGDASDQILSAWTKLRSQWDRSSRYADQSQKARYDAAHRRIRELAERKTEEHDETAQSNLARFETILARMEEVISAEEVSIKDADKAVRDAQDFLREMGPLPKGVNRKQARRKLSAARELLVKQAGQTREMEEWKRWANADVQEGLIRRIEALKDVKDLPKVAKEMRVIHEEWRRAGSVPPQKAEELWTRYKSVRDELKPKCDEFFAHQDKERKANLEKKQELCEKVEALKDDENWNKTADAIKEIQAQWKAIGPVPTKKSDAIWKRFRAACDAFFERRKSHFDALKESRDENLKKKEALCARAEEVQDSTEWPQTVGEIKRLQAEWREIGPVPRKKSDAIWKRFRTACDHFFDRYKRRDEIAAEQTLEKRKTLLGELEAMPADADDASKGSRARVLEIWTEWRKLGPLSNDHEDLRSRFHVGIARVVELAPQDFEGTELDPVVNRKKRERLVKQLEEVVKEYSTATHAASDPLEDLAARLKDALATNTMTGGKARPKKLDWRRAEREVSRHRASWLKVGPVPGEEGRALEQRFLTVVRNFQELRRDEAAESASVQHGA
jgi:uncharacterized pyridoxal phosphate-containing UPF0001 family protein